MYTVKTHNDVHVDTNFTSLKGHLKCPRYKLVEMFGEPLGASDKVINEWNLLVTDESGESGVITIYDWKNYDLTELPYDYDDWNVGGHRNDCQVVLLDVIEQMQGLMMPV